MSDDARQWVKQHSQHRGNTKFVLLMIADHCRDGSTSCSPSIDTLAAETGISERQVRRIVDTLVESRELIAYENKGPYGSNLYHLPLGSGSVLPDTMSARKQVDDNLPDILPDIHADTMSGSENSSGHSSGHLSNPPTPPYKVLNTIPSGDADARVRERLTAIFTSIDQANVAIAAAVRSRGGFSLADVELCEHWLDAQRPEWSGKVGSLYKTLKAGQLPVMPRVNGNGYHTNGHARAGPPMAEVPDETEAEIKQRSAAKKAEILKDLPSWA